MRNEMRSLGVGVLAVLLALTCTAPAAAQRGGPCPKWKDARTGKCKGNQPRHCKVDGKPGVCFTVNDRVRGTTDCRCFPKAGQNTATAWQPDGEFKVPELGESATLTFRLDSSHPYTESLVFYVGDAEAGEYEATPVSGMITLVATRSSETVVEIETVASVIVAKSVDIPELGATGLNELRYDRLTGTLDLDSGLVELLGTGTITNDLYPEQRPAVFLSAQTGSLDLATGELTMSTTAEDTPPEEVGPAGNTPTQSGF